MHEAVRDGKDAVIAELRARVAYLEGLVATPPPPVKVTLEVPPSPLQRAKVRTPKASETEHQENKRIDYSQVDENDNEAMAWLAAQELGGPVSAFVLQQTIQRIRSHIRHAKSVKLRNALEEGTVGTGVSPSTRARKDAPPVEVSDYVPAHILAMVQAAEAV